MGRRPNESEPSRWVTMVLLLMGLVSCSLVYMFMSVAFRPNSVDPSLDLESVIKDEEGKLSDGKNGGCCKGIENLELWGSAVKWGTDFKFNTSEECCQACKKLCTGNDGPCLCDSWVFCGNQEACGPKFGECWLKKQKDTLAPERQEAGKSVSWTSGFVFGKGEGIIGLETEHGTLHIKLLADCAPHSVNYILQLLELRHCAGCQFYRAESRGRSWDSEGNHIKDASLGPPYGLVQGLLEPQGTIFSKIPIEDCPTIKRGSVAWIGSGPEFFISLANHEEWRKAYTVFGTVLPEDMGIAEKISELPTKADVWNNINVSVLEKPVPLLLKRIKMSSGDLNLNEKAGRK